MFSWGLIERELSFVFPFFGRHKEIKKKKKYSGLNSCYFVFLFYKSVPFIALFLHFIEFCILRSSILLSLTIGEKDNIAHSRLCATLSALSWPSWAAPRSRTRSSWLRTCSTRSTRWLSAVGWPSPSGRSWTTCRSVHTLSGYIFWPFSPPIHI